LFCIALFAPLISNNKPLVYINSNKIYFPALDDLFTLSPSITDNNYTNGFSIFPLIPYTPKQIDFNNTNYASPLKKQNVPSIYYRHWLGTDLLGRDVLSGLIYGSRIALLIGFISMWVSFVIGFLLGSLAGYLADDTIKINWIELLLLLLFILFCFYYVLIVLKFEWIFSWKNGLLDFIKLTMQVALKLLLLGFVLFTIVKTLRKWSLKLIKPSIYLPVDFVITRFIEVFESIPTLFLIIALMALVKPSIGYVITIIGLTAWMPLARYTRAEFLKLRKRAFIEAAHALGYGHLRIILVHIFPNTLGPLLISLTFGIAGAILAESTLSFLGLGLSADEVTWGSLLASARQAPNAWWLVVFPGLMIFVTVAALNSLGHRLIKTINKQYNV
jgi:peptide/nickel transport system permease protein